MAKTSHATAVLVSLSTVSLGLVSVGHSAKVQAATALRQNSTMVASAIAQATLKSDQNRDTEHSHDDLPGDEHDEHYMTPVTHIPVCSMKMVSFGLPCSIPIILVD
ncbi:MULTISPECIES: hypothetical protein [unclassified Arsukibacterium]|uniref:hypothetical protein n=1 Tax=unclassified Arsukibacterium TaxID=2635278 RepID=UPI000C932A3E|nr:MULTISPECIES: hypothetical protein [unclassified Arsukibacterium]MAA95493.1 hypothetical protein [Rheinheimera sp.]HAW92735.1 hypothetical protein [Candidatus Azambacteria bacterium]